MKDVKKLIYGILARIIGLFVPVRRGLWVFGSDCGNMYREGSKYLIEYMLKNHPEYDCRFVTQSKKVYKELNQRGIPCVMNLSVYGAFVVAMAQCVFTTQMQSDILYAFKKRGRHFFYLVHGQPYKVAIKELEKTKYREKAEFKQVEKRSKIIKWLRRTLNSYFVCDTGFDDSEFVSATSEFLSALQKRDFGEKMPSKILGMPRNDALFQHWRMKNEKWVPGLDGRWVVSYMPTHRLYGRGALSPTPFKDRPDMQKWMSENNVVLLVKNHPTMLLYKKEINQYESDCIIDITMAGIDPMTVLYHSDVLITDYSSVWMDYLLLKRPILFYIYDNFLQDDAGVYYDVKKEGVGTFCYSEDELFRAIKDAKANTGSMIPGDNVLRKFHKYIDGNSCERYFCEIASSI